MVICGGSPEYTGVREDLRRHMASSMESFESSRSSLSWSSSSLFLSRRSLSLALLLMYQVCCCLTILPGQVPYLASTSFLNSSLKSTSLIKRCPSNGPHVK